MNQLQTRITEARALLDEDFGTVRSSSPSSEAVPAGFLKRLQAVPDESDGPEEQVLTALRGAMEAIMSANDIVHKTKGQLTKRDARPLTRLASDLEGSAVDIMSAAKKLR